MCSTGSSRSRQFSLRPLVTGQSAHKGKVGRHLLALMCRTLTVTFQMFYQWHKRGIRRAVRCMSWRELKSRGISVDEKRVGRLMREHVVRAKGGSKPKATADSTHSRPVSANTLDRDFTASAPACGKLALFCCQHFSYPVTSIVRHDGGRDTNQFYGWTSDGAPQLWVV